MSKLKVYYAHCMAIYNTEQEKRDVALLEALGYEVANPNCAASNEGYKKEGMAYFQRFANDCDLVAFRANPDGFIPAGVAKEITMFQTLNKPVIELPCGITRRTLSVEATREHLKECGFR